ncbi:MAG: hypothetical protein JXA33_16580, partial [Anaerolineae bacterium]|nr:hypothetical protein [Anaerolineae bacterium]
LADAGLGGLRSTGHGGFTFELSDFTMFNRNLSDYAVTLARYLPAGAAEIASTLQASHAAYKLVVVGGWCQDNTGHPWRRKQVRMVREGSIIGWNNEALGYIADVVPELPPGMDQFGGRPVLRYGVPFPIPVAKEALL